MRGSGVYLFLGYRAHLFRPDWRTAGWGLAVYVFWSWPAWARNLTVEESRAVFSCFNWDIGPWSFLLQELRSITFSLLVGGVIQVLAEQQKRFAAAIAPSVSREPGSGEPAGPLPECRRCPAALAGGDVPSDGGVCPVQLSLLATRRPAGETEDTSPRRSETHLLWIVLWIAATVIVIDAIKLWSTARDKWLTDQFRRQDRLEESIRLASEISPIGQHQVTMAVVSGLISFVIPVLQLFF